MNIEINFLTRAYTQNLGSNSVPGSRYPIAADMMSAATMPEYETFWLIASARRTIVRCGRVGVEFQLPKNGNHAAKGTLVAWINAEGNNVPSVAAAAQKLGGRALPVRRSSAGFHASFKALQEALA